MMRREKTQITTDSPMLLLLHFFPGEKILVGVHAKRHLCPPMYLDPGGASVVGLWGLAATAMNILAH